ncbi:MAG: hypothetical protein AAFU55_09760 [Pseudomonadota bacterium]
MAGSAFAADPRQTAARQCGENRDWRCAWMNYADFYRDEADAKLVYSEAAGPTLGGARVEYVVDRLAEEGDAEEARSAAELAIDFVSQRHKGTRHLMTSLHLSRAEACAALADSDCAAESVAYLCENQTKLALPSFVKTEGDRKAFIGRIETVLSNCQEH